MADQPPSPKRRRILASINPEEPPLSNPKEIVSPKQDSIVEDAYSEISDPNKSERTNRKSSKFRFKSKHSKSRRHSRHHDRHDDEDENDRSHRSSHTREGGDLDDNGDRARENPSSESHHRHHHRRHRSRRHKRRRRSRSRSPTPPNPHEPPPLSPDSAFRQSLFDAMADDEGAAYWESIYGQPMHVYSDKKTGAQGELEQMDDDEYAAYVRQKMWEKTHQGLLEERARREEMRRQKDTKEKESRRLTKEMEESLRRGEERRKKKAWRTQWDEYADAWTAWDGTLESMSWPVASRRREDVQGDSVREFFVRGLDPTDIGEKEFLSKLKDERVRWHPDKIQQRLGRTQFDGSVSRDVTAVFQIIDKLWSDTRSKV